MKVSQYTGSNNVVESTSSNNVVESTSLKSCVDKGYVNVILFSWLSKEWLNILRKLSLPSLIFFVYFLQPIA